MNVENDQSQFDAYRLVLGAPSALRISNVPVDTLILPDRVFQVRYEARGATPVHLGVTAERRPPASPTLPSDFVSIADNLAPGEGAVDWDVPFDLRSPHVRLVLVDTLGAERRVAYSSRFRVRPLVLARVRPDSTYQLFDVGQHGFASGNIRSQLFPDVWQARPEFTYSPLGSDPFRGGAGYPFWMSLPPVHAERADFPDWPSYVGVFGSDVLYDADGPRFREVDRWSQNTDSWGGSCFGFSHVALMVFVDPARAAARFPGLGFIDDNLFSAVGLLSDNPGALRVVNRTQTWQFGTEYDAVAEAAQGQTVGNVIRDLQARLRSDDGLAYRALSIREFDGTPGSGAHSLLPTEVRELSGAPGAFNIFVYDSNHPLDDSRFIRVDTLSGGWRYDDPALDPDDGAWFGFGPALRLVFPVEAVFENATLAPLQRSGGGGLEIAATPFADIRIRDAQGRTSGFTGNLLLDGIPGAIPFIPDTGGPSAPFSYRLPAGAYGVTLSNAPGPEVRASFFPETGDAFGFAHQSGTPASADRLAYDAVSGLRAANAAGDARPVSLFGLRTTGDEERLLAVEDLALAAGDSASVQVVGDAALAIRGGATPTRYVLRLLRRAPSETRAFLSAEVTLAAGAVHTAVPVWNDLSTVRLDIDADGNGTVDETLPLANTVAAGPSPERPEALGLAVAPNPSRGGAVAHVALPAPGAVRVTVIDALGRTVAVLLDGELAAGTHAVPLDASRLAPGVYVVRLDGPVGVLTRRLTVAR